MGTNCSAQTPSAVEPVEFNPFCEEAISDPIAYQRWMRQAGEVLVYRGHKHPLYALTRHADIRALWQDPTSATANYGQMPEFTQEPGLRNDPPEHTIFRNLVNPYFSIAAVKRMTGVYETTANRLIDKMTADRSEADFCADFCAQYPISVAAGTLGVDASRYDDFHSWASEISNGNSTFDMARVEAAKSQIFDYFRTLLAVRRQRLADATDNEREDLLAHLVLAVHPEGRPFHDDELLQLLLLLLIGATDTTAGLLGGCMTRLLQEPDLLQAARNQPELGEIALEESLRFDPPVMATWRTTAKPLTIAGVDIPAGVKIAGYYACANRDPAIFDDPDTFRLDRPLSTIKRHMAFGFGIHHCLGSHLARLDARVALQVVLNRLPKLRLNGKPQFRVLPFLRGAVSLPVRWD
ncbi:cytochrome P450 [Caballeronia sp. LZ001]|uniref:cytochrome P450 n=1 Tax=Caballeronia sp. LZ001 TaxID=3038553 RepID=UPI0028633EB5|nr:cytochrome P450 [Caballeronia sp. LZ001]MDR5804838.1 cytochrome P450 [Caballeronia sp. LZ001]